MCINRMRCVIFCLRLNQFNCCFLKSDPECLNLAKVNFFNLLNSNDIKKEAEKCIRSNGVGSCGPRGFYGTIGMTIGRKFLVSNC